MCEYFGEIFLFLLFMVLLKGKEVVYFIYCYEIEGVIMDEIIMNLE